MNSKKFTIIFAMLALFCLMTPTAFASNLRKLQDQVPEDVPEDVPGDIIEMVDEEADFNVIDEQEPGVPEEAVPEEDVIETFVPVEETGEDSTETGPEVTIPSAGNVTPSAPTTGTVTIESPTSSASALGVSSLLVLSAVAINMLA